MKKRLTYTLLLNTSGLSGQTSNTPIQFAKSLLKSQQHIACIFFYGDACAVANNLSQFPTDEINPLSLWQILAQENNLKLKLCSTTSLKRGVIDPIYANNFNNKSFNLATSFEFSSILELIDAIKNSDRFIQFGSVL